MSARLKLDVGGLKQNIEAVPEKLTRVVVGITDLTATRGENSMRKNAPWKDRTTNARNGLNTAATHSRDQHEIVFAHGVSYGIWLETRWAGKYQIIMPTVLNEGKKMMKLFNKAITRM